MKAFLTIVLVVFMSLSSQAQEKRIKFNKGTLKICSKKIINVVGYDGDEIIIKKKESKTFSNTTKNEHEVKSEVLYEAAMDGREAGKLFYKSKEERMSHLRLQKLLKNNKYSISSNLKRLGGKSNKTETGLDFMIERKHKEIIIKDDLKEEDIYKMLPGEEYQFKIPNSIKLIWETEKCGNEPIKEKKGYSYNSNLTHVQNFDGELEVSVTLNDISLIDVTGPVSVNSIGGNISIEFRKKKPTKLYSVYSNNGYIELRVPNDSDLLINASGSSIYSDLKNIKVLEETESNNSSDMKLKLNKGLVRMNLDAGYGNVYLRKDDLDIKKAAN